MTGSDPDTEFRLVLRLCGDDEGGGAAAVKKLQWMTTTTQFCMLRSDLVRWHERIVRRISSTSNERPT